MNFNIVKRKIIWHLVLIIILFFNFSEAKSGDVLRCMENLLSREIASSAASLLCRKNSQSSAQDCLVYLADYKQNSDSLPMNQDAAALACSLVDTGDGTISKSDIQTCMTTLHDSKVMDQASGVVCSKDPRTGNWDYNRARDCLSELANLEIERGTEFTEEMVTVYENGEYYTWVDGEKVILPEEMDKVDNKSKPNHIAAAQVCISQTGSALGQAKDCFRALLEKGIHDNPAASVCSSSCDSSSSCGDAMDCVEELVDSESLSIAHIQMGAGILCAQLKMISDRGRAITCFKRLIQMNVTGTEAAGLCMADQFSQATEHALTTQCEIYAI